MSLMRDGELSAWDLANPTVPVPIGTVRLLRGGRGMGFAYAPAWLAAEVALSGDMPLRAGLLVPQGQAARLGALDDAMPDRWGERAIRFLDNPPRLTDIDFLYRGGDRRFGNLGFSLSADAYVPHAAAPLPGLASLDALHDLVERIEAREPLNPQESLLAGSTRSMGGAHPKALASIDGREWIVKFSRGDYADRAAIEHASLVLAQRAGIVTPPSRLVRGISGSAMAVLRFDRAGQRRLRALSARTVLLHGADPMHGPAGELSYSAMADFLRLAADPRTLRAQQAELFRRMVFNILIENTDDHEKNHAFLFEGGHWRLAPAFDVLPLMSNIGPAQQMIVGDFGAEATFENAVSRGARFSLGKNEATAEWFRVAECVAGWKDVFAGCGVSGRDIDYLTQFIEAPWRMELRAR